MTEGWGHPRDAAGFACQWATEVRAARALGERVGPGRYLELRYEALVADPAGELRRICSFAGLEYDDAMLGYVGRDRVGPEGAPAAAERAAARRRARLEHRDAARGPGGVRGGRRRPARRARLSGHGAGPRPTPTRDVPREDGGLAGRRAHAALAALAASARAPVAPAALGRPGATSGPARATARRLAVDDGTCLTTRPDTVASRRRYAGPLRPRNATSIPLSEK